MSPIGRRVEGEGGAFQVRGRERAKRDGREENSGILVVVLCSRRAQHYR